MTDVVRALVGFAFIVLLLALAGCGWEMGEWVARQILP